MSTVATIYTVASKQDGEWQVVQATALLTPKQARITYAAGEGWAWGYRTILGVADLDRSPQDAIRRALAAQHRQAGRARKALERAEAAITAIGALS